MKLPSFLFKKVKEHKTSLGNNEAFPPEEDFPFDYKILKTRFEEVINKINKYEDIESLEENYLISLLNKLITQCKEKENPIKEHIEKLCEKIVSETFRIPNETINLNIKLTDKLSPSKQFNLTPPTSKERTFDFDDLNDFKDSEKVILKRRLINSLIQGASYEYSTKTVMHLDEISSLLSDLKPLYERIIVINDFLLFTKKESITDDKIHQGAIVEVLLGRGDEKTEINVQGLTFPFLLNETFRGMFELFAAHGLPQDIDKANYILQQADFLLAEPWDLRMGVTLWNILSENVYGYESMPYFFMTLCEMNTDEFNLNLKEVFAQTKKGKQFIIDLNEYALKEAEYDSDIEPLDINDVDNELITDAYISSDGLDYYHLTDDDNADPNGMLEESNSFETWFGNSVLIDSEGKPIKMYHGTKNKFDEFSKDFIGSTGSYEGYGFNFTPFEGRAANYNNENVIEAYLRAENPMTSKSYKITPSKLAKIIAELDKGKPYTDTIVAAYEPSRYNEKWDAMYYRRALPVAAKMIYQYNKENDYGDAGLYAEICVNGNADKYQVIELFEKLGYDSVIFYDNYDRINTVIVFEPNQIKLVSNKTFNNNSNLMSENNKKIQSDIIQKYNPRLKDTYSTWINSEEDILTFDEMFEKNIKYYNEYGGLVYPDTKIEDLILSKRTRKIKVYSSYPIKQGVFVSMSKMCAKDYSGGKTIYSKYVDVDDIAWIDEHQGQYANVNEYLNENINNKQKKIYINESQLSLLTESQASKSEHQAVILVMNRFGYSKEQAYEFVHEKIRHDIYPLKDKELGKFILGVTRMCCDDELNDARAINDINATLILLKAHLNEYDRNLNGLSAQELISRFAQIRQDNLDAEKSKIDQMTFGESNYKIVPINSFEEAEQYYRYTYSESPWCITHMENMFETYTCDGINQIYFCLRNGFENEEPIVGENVPLDDYGLSMISVIVNENGELAHCTTRWNHKNGGTDNSMSAKGVSEVVGVNFYQVFKPNNKWSELIENVKQRIANGEPLDSVFDRVYNFSEGLAMVKLNKKCNYIKQDGEFLTDKWYDACSNFINGFGIVKSNNKCNFINQEGNLLSPNKWYDYCNEFKDGFGIVHLNDKCTYIKQDGEYLINEWFDYCESFSNGFAKVELNGKGYNFINANGKLLFPNQWFVTAKNFGNGLVKVELKHRFNVINSKGELVSPNQWFDYCYDFENSFSRVELNNKYNFINTNGELLSPNQWFDDCDDFYNGFARVELNNKYNFINTNGELLSPNQWYDFCHDFYNGFAVVRLDNKYNYLNQNGKILSPNQWFDKCENFYNGFAKVKLNGKWYKISNSGELFDENGKKLNENINNKSHFSLLREGLYDDFDVRDADIIYYNHYQEDWGDEEEPDIQDLYDILIYDMDGNIIYENDGLLLYELDDILGENISYMIYNNESEPNTDSFLSKNYPYRLNYINSHEFGDVNETAKQLFKNQLTEYYPNLHGYIMQDGTCIDLGGDDHNTICKIPQINDKWEFIALGNIRCSNSFFDLIQEPTREQKYALRKLIANSNDLSVDIFSEDSVSPLTSAIYRGTPNPSYVLGQIDRFFDEGINLQGGYSDEDYDDFYMYESIEYLTESELDDMKPQEEQEIKYEDLILSCSEGDIDFREEPYNLFTVSGGKQRGMWTLHVIINGVEIPTEFIFLRAEEYPKLKSYQLHMEIAKNLRQKGIGFKLYQAFIRIFGTTCDLFINNSSTFYKDNNASIDSDVAVDKLWDKLIKLPNVKVSYIVNKLKQKVGIKIDKI